MSFSTLVAGTVAFSYSACSPFHSLDNYQLNNADNNLESTNSNSDALGSGSSSNASSSNSSGSSNSNSAGNIGNSTPSSPSIADDVKWSHEPAGFSKILDYDFSSTQGSGVDNYYKCGQIVSDPTAPFSPDKVFKSFMIPGSLSGGCQLDYYLPKLKEVYVGIWWKPNIEFEGIHNSGNKLFFIKIPESPAFLAWYGPHDSNNFTGQLVFNTQNWGTLDNCHIASFKGECPGSGWFFPNVGSTVPRRGQWNKIEMYVKISTTNTSKNGTFMWWLNGELIGDFNNVNFGPSGIESWNWSETWTGDQKVQTKEWAHYLDHLYISVRK